MVEVERMVGSTCAALRNPTRSLSGSGASPVVIHAVTRTVPGRGTASSRASGNRPRYGLSGNSLYRCAMPCWFNRREWALVPPQLCPRLGRHAGLRNIHHLPTRLCAGRDRAGGARIGCAGRERPAPRSNGRPAARSRTGTTTRRAGAPKSSPSSTPPFAAVERSAA